MKHLRILSASAFACMSFSAALAVDPASAIRRVVEDASVQSQAGSWTIPFVIDSRLHERGGFASLGEYYANYKGRQMTMAELIAGARVTENISFWLGRQSYFVKGRNVGNRLRVNDDIYGVKWVVKPPKSASDPSIAVEYQATRPGTASAVTNSAGATFFATKNNAVAIDYGFANGIESQLLYASVKGANSGDASIYALGAGKDLSLQHGLELRVQANLVGQSYTDLVQHVNFELKPVAYASLGYNAAPWARVEGDVTLLPSGIPLGGTHFTGLSSFEIYRPGGVTEELRKNFVVFGALRLVFHGKF